LNSDDEVEVDVTSFVSSVSIVCEDGWYKSRLTSGKRKEDILMILILRENKRKKSLVVSFQNRLKNEIGRNDRLNIVQIDECIVEF
jgi:hypothetical protein